MTVVVGGDKVEESKTLIGWVGHDNGELVDWITVDTGTLGDSMVGTRAVSTRGINVEMGIEDMYPVDIGDSRVVGDTTSELVLIVTVAQISKGVEGVAAVEEVRCLIQTTGMSERVSPVIDNTIERIFVGFDLVTVGSVDVVTSISIVDVVSVMVFGIWVVALVSPFVWIDGHDRVEIVGNIDISASTDVVTKILELMRSMISEVIVVSVLETILVIVVVVHITVLVKEFAVMVHVSQRVRVPA
jgi:hypothetical protein